MQIFRKNWHFLFLTHASFHMLKLQTFGGSVICRIEVPVEHLERLQVGRPHVELRLPVVREARREAADLRGEGVMPGGRSPAARHSLWHSVCQLLGKKMARCWTGTDFWE